MQQRMSQRDILAEAGLGYYLICTMPPGWIERQERRRHLMRLLIGRRIVTRCICGKYISDRYTGVICSKCKQPVIPRIMED